MEGKGFRPNTPVRVQWRTEPSNPQSRIIAVTTVVTDANGNFAPTPAYIFKNDPSGMRTMEADSGPNEVATQQFLVVPATTQPSGSEALATRRTLLLQRR